MLIRTISALVGAPLLLGLTYLGGPYTAFLVAVITILALQEFLGMGRKMGMKTWSKSTSLAALVWLLVIFGGNKDFMLPLLVLWLLISLGRLAIGFPQVTLTEVTYNFLALIYTVVLLSHLYLLRELPRGLEWAFLSFILVWVTDTCAYLIGRAFGRHPLAPRISPNKTIEGAIGALIGAVLAALISANVIRGVPWPVFLGLGLIAGVSAQIGDLFESALKRTAGVKDSGSLIPGHGGILDRFDSFVFTLPLIYYCVLFGIVG